MGKLSPSFSLFPQPGNGKIPSCILNSFTKVKNGKKIKWPFSIFHWGHIVSSRQVHGVKEFKIDIGSRVLSIDNSNSLF